MLTTASLRALAERGLFPPGNALADVVTGGEAAGAPAHGMTARVAGGLDVDLSLARGFDIGQVRLAGAPLSWCSPIRDSRPLDRPRASDWIERFTGGLVTTCGPEHIGAARADLPMHGTFDHRPARLVTARTINDARAPKVELEAVIDVAAVFAPSLRIRRSITIDEGPLSDGADDTRPRGRITLLDEVCNLGPGPAPVAMLYHVNLGAPLVEPGTTVEVPGGTPRAREPVPEVPDARIMPAPATRVVEAVFAYDAPRTDGGWAEAVVTSQSGARTVVRWSADTLPHLFQWVLPTRGRWALAIEPSTTPLFAPEPDALQVTAPVLDEGETRAQSIEISAAW